MEAETLRQKLVAEAEATFNVTRIENAMKTEAKKAEADAQSYRAKPEADAESYRQMKQVEVESYRQLKQAEGNAQLLTQEYLQLRWAEAISNTTKVSFGPSVGSLMSGVLHAADALAAAMPTSAAAETAAPAQSCSQPDATAP